MSRRGTPRRNPSPPARARISRRVASGMAPPGTLERRSSGSAPGPGQGGVGEGHPALEQVVHVGAQAEPPEEERREGRDQEALEDPATDRAAPQDRDPAPQAEPRG